MSLILKLALFVFSIIMMTVITFLLRKDKIPVKFTLPWYFSSLIILLLSLLPIILEFISSLIGFETTSNLVVGILITILLYITLSITIIISAQNKKIILLIQEVSLLKKALEDYKK